MLVCSEHGVNEPLTPGKAAYAQTPTLDCIYGPCGDGWLGGEGGRRRRGGGGGSCTAQLWLWPGSNQNTGAVKAPLDESQGAVSGQNAGLGLKVQGYVLSLMRSTRWASRPPRARRRPISRTRNAAASFYIKKAAPDHRGVPRIADKCCSSPRPCDRPHKAPAAEW